MSNEATGAGILMAGAVVVVIATRGMVAVEGAIERVVAELHCWSYGALEGVRAYRVARSRARERVIG